MTRGSEVTKIRPDPRKVALAHPTRFELYRSLLQVDEMATVGLEREVGVTRYHLYHHLSQLVKAGLIENHRDVGRARWWRAIHRMELDDGAPVEFSSEIATPRPDWVKGLPAQMVEMMEKGARIEFVPLGSAAADVVNAKHMLEEIAASNGIDLSMPFTFVPGGILLISQPR